MLLRRGCLPGNARRMIQSVGHFFSYPQITGNEAPFGKTPIEIPIRPIRWMMLFGLKGPPSILSIK